MEVGVRTNINIDDDLLSAAQAASGALTKKETVHRGLELLVRLERQRGLRELRGALEWDDDLTRMRAS